MVTQFNKISSPVSLFFLQGKFLSFYWIKEYWTFSTFENSDYFLTIVLRNDFDLQTVKGCPHSFLFFFWKINFGCFENIIRNSLLALSVRQTKMEVRIRCDWKLWFLVCLKAKIGLEIPFLFRTSRVSKFTKFFKVLHTSQYCQKLYLILFFLTYCRALTGLSLSSARTLSDILGDIFFLSVNISMQRKSINMMLSFLVPRSFERKRNFNVLC